LTTFDVLALAFIELTVAAAGRFFAPVLSATAIAFFVVAPAFSAAGLAAAGGTLSTAASDSEQSCL
jgi:hypothetical protein